MAKKRYSLFEIEIQKNFSSGISTKVDWEPTTNIIESEIELIFEIELPGVKREDVFIELQQNTVLMVSGIKKQPKISDTSNYYLFEREFGSFNKRIALNIPIDSDKIESFMVDGVLKIIFPKGETKNILFDIKKGGGNE